MRRGCLLFCGLIAAAIFGVPSLADERPDKRLLEASRKNLRALQEAMMAYQNAHGAFPPQALLGGDGKPTLSWRVALLPHLGDEAAKLYKEFKLHEPWDSPHNKKLLAKRPKVYAPVANELMVPFTTYYQVFTGPTAPFKVGKLQGPRMASFRDGLANTALIVEAGDAVPWTKPADLAVDPKKPLPKLGGMFKGFFHIAMANCQDVHFMRRDFNELTMRHIIDPNDGQPVLFDTAVEKR
jgi:hypothetical protein